MFRKQGVSGRGIRKQIMVEPSALIRDRQEQVSRPLTNTADLNTLARVLSVPVHNRVRQGFMESQFHVIEVYRSAWQPSHEFHDVFHRPLETIDPDPHLIVKLNYAVHRCPADRVLLRAESTSKRAPTPARV